MKDKNGKIIEIGDLVDVPDPNPDDAYNHEFQGQVAGFHGDFVSVEDGDNDVFDIEPERLVVLP